MICKKGEVLGEGIIMIYRLVLVTIIAFAIFGVSSIFYAYHIEIRDSEAIILTRQVSDCLSPDGILDLDIIPENSRKSILSYCGFSFSDRLYVGIEVVDYLGNVVAEFSQGDSSANWVRKITQGKGKYDPGYRTFEYPVFVNGAEGKVKMEVVVSHEF